MIQQDNLSKPIILCRILRSGFSRIHKKDMFDSSADYGFDPYEVDDGFEGEDYDREIRAGYSRILRDPYFSRILRSQLSRIL